MKQIHLEASWIIKASREKIYEIMSDFENMPKYFPKVAQMVRIINRDGNNLTIKADVKSFGKVFKVNMKTKLCPPRGFVSNNESELGTSGHEEFLMEEVAGGTKINYTYELNIHKRWLRIIAKPLIEWFAMKSWERSVINKLKEMLEK